MAGRFTPERFTGLIVIVGIGWRLVRYLMQFPIWGDEAYVCLNFLDRDYLGLTYQLEFGQVAPLLFLWLEYTAFWVLGSSELALRFFPVLAGVAGLLLFWRLSRDLLSPLAVAFAVGILAVAYYPVRHAVEVKPYAFDLLMTLILVGPTLAWIRQPDRVVYLALLALVTPLALWFSYPAVFVAGACSVVLLPMVWWGTWPARGWYALFNLLLVGSFFAHLACVGRPLDADSTATVNQFLQHYWRDWFPPENPLAWPGWLLQAHTGNMFAYPIGGSHGASILTTILACLGGIALWRQGHRHLVGLGLVTVLLSLIAAFFHKYPYGGSARLAQHLAPFICWFAGAGLAVLAQRWPRCTQPVFLFLLVIGLGGTFISFIRPYKTISDEWARRIPEIWAEQPTVVVHNSPAVVRGQVLWYLRRGTTTLAWNDAEIPGCVDFWAVRFRFGDEPAWVSVPAWAQGWTQVARRDWLLPAESKDVPLQYVEMTRWKK